MQLKLLLADDFAAFVGIDWADAKHDVCLQAADSAQRESSTLAHQPEAIDEWVRALRQRFQNKPIAIGLELRRPHCVGASKVRLRGAVSDQPIDAGQVP